LELIIEYFAAGRAGRDGNKSTCIMFHSTRDVQAHHWMIENPSENSDRKNIPPVPEETKNEQKRLLQRTCEFVQSKKCRRVELLKYLEAGKDEYEKLLINEECCDNCKKTLTNGQDIPPKLMYEGIKEDGTIDCSSNLRLLLASLREVSSVINDPIDHLLGIIPYHGADRSTQLFGAGKKISREFWTALLSAAHRRGFWEDNALNKKGKSFLRNNLLEEFMIPSQDMLAAMTKRENIVFYWDDNQIKSRPKSNGELIHEKYGIPANVQQGLTKEESDQIELLLSQDMLDVDEENDDDIIEKTMSGLTEDDFVDLTKEHETDEEIVQRTMRDLTEDDFIDLTGEEEVSMPPKKQRLH
jgi:hypothetical protein